MTPASPGIAVIAARVRAGRQSARALAEAAIAAIERLNPAINAVTHILNDRARAEAAAVDAIVAAGHDPGPLAGVPYGVKDLFDIAGLPTTAGAALLRDAPPALTDAEAIARLKAAGAVLVATLNMDEFAYGFATVNATWGTTRNPHDPARLAGGSSGGSAAAVASGMLPFALGSDTNGSIRIPASLCGLYGTKPTHGSLPMAGVYPFVDSLDDIGVFSRAACDLPLLHAVLAGSGGERHWDTPRVAILGGWFADNRTVEMVAAMDVLAHALGDPPVVTLPHVGRARSAAFLMTAAEGGARHLPALRADPMRFDPATRDRFIAGAALPTAAYLDAVAERDLFAQAVASLFRDHDILIAPAVPGPAPRVDDPLVTIDGQRVPARAMLGIYTQPLSFVGLPVVAAPLPVQGLPLGVQLIGAPGSDARLYRFAAELEAAGWLAAPSIPAQQVSFS
jgi:AtzE family amidohydrolase